MQRSDWILCTWIHTMYSYNAISHALRVVTINQSWYCVVLHTFHIIHRIYTIINIYCYKVIVPGNITIENSTWGK